MTETRYSDDQLLMAARLYYEDGRSQTDVARMVNVSQAKVSRMLALARQRGIVRITVQAYDPRQHAMERRLERRLGLRSAIVIKGAANSPGDEVRRVVGHFAAPDVAGMIPPKAILAVSGGRSVRELVRAMPAPEKPANLTVVQAMGNIDAQVGSFDAVELARTIVERWGGSLLMLNTPAFVPDRKTRDAFLTLTPIRTVKRRLAQATVAIVGIGTLENSVFQERGVLGQADRARLRSAGAVGEICGRFFDPRGRECDTPYRQRVISIELDEVRRIPQVIGVAAGGDRCAAIVAAVRGGLLKSLVIDEAGAEAIVNFREAPRAAG